VSSSIEVYRENKDGKFLETAYKSVERSVELIKRMRELESLVSSGVSLRPFDVRDTLQTAINNWMNEGIEFTIKGDSVVLADETFVSVIENIIRNAVVHGRADRVEIAVRDDGEYTEIRIADNGTGVPDELKEEIFEEGFTGNSKGTGLGLYIARKTVERYGGSIRVEDNKPRGAIFILTLKTVSDYSGIRSSLKIPVTDHHSSVSNFSKAEEWKGDDKMIEVETDRKEVEIDLKGLKCPQPILRIHSKVVTLSNGSILKVKADCPTFERDLKIWAEKTGKTVMECVKSGDVWNARILA
jgi:TusA-related sulfurtransferase/two-component sensor histidine kinase